MWAYRDCLPAAGGVEPGQITLGEKTTSLVAAGTGTWLKLDYELPTGSFKARGAAVMIGLGKGLGARRVIVDSSGNAGKAAAAYAGAAGLAAEIHVPAATDPDKVAAMRSFGATVVVDPGDRAAASAAARARVDAGAGWYASHVHQPAFHHGVKTLAFELVDQLGGAPATVVVPAGNGTLVLGLWIGFAELLQAGRIGSRPVIVAVQASRCAPLAGSRPTGATMATGIAIADPPRSAQIRAAVMASNGVVVVVDEDAIGSAVDDLAGRNIHVEPTGAVGWAGLGHLRRGPAAGAARPPVVVVLTGR
jgi:threonine synthase